jgi:hypothetical protein
MVVDIYESSTSLMKSSPGLFRTFFNLNLSGAIFGKTMAIRNQHLLLIRQYGIKYGGIPQETTD